MKFTLKAGEYHGRSAWCHEAMDALRREQGMCLKCGGLDQCGTAKALYALCVQNGTALAVTRCPKWYPNSGNNIHPAIHQSHC